MTKEEAGLAFFLLLDLDFRTPSCCLIYGNKKARLSRLMVATEQVWKIMTWGL
jgi:hypothetical protein